MDSRHLSYVARDYDRVSGNIMATLRTIQMQATDGRVKAACNALISQLSEISMSQDASAEDAVIALYQEISKLNAALEQDTKRTNATASHLEKLNNILDRDLDMDATTKAEIEKRLSSPRSSPVSSRSSSPQQQRPARPTKPIPSTTTTSTITREKVLRSSAFQTYLKALPSYKNILKMIEENPQSERAKSWQAFLSKIDQSKNHQSTDLSWMDDFEKCHAIIEKSFAENEDIPEKDKEDIRRKYGDVGEGLGHIITNRYMNNEEFILINDFFCDIKQYLHDKAGEPEFDPLFLPQTKTEEIKRNPPTAAEQFDNDVKTFTPWLYGNHTDSVRNARVDIVKRLLLTLKLNADELKLKNANSDKKENLGDANKKLTQNEQVPLAALISHGGRCMIELPPSSNPNEFIDWLFGGKEAVSVAHDNITATSEGKAVYTRVAATHAAKYDEERGEYIELKGAAVKDIASGVLIEPRHMGVDLGLAGPNRAAPKDTGSFGHLYMYYIPPTATTPGVFMFGVEGSAPSGTRDTMKRFLKKATDKVSEKISSAETILSRAGEGHGTSGVSSDISPTDGRKWRAIKTDANASFQPDSLNGLTVKMSTGSLRELITHTASELQPADLAQPAGIPAQTLVATITSPNFQTTNQAAVDRACKIALINAIEKLLPTLTDNFIPTLNRETIHKQFTALQEQILTDSADKFLNVMEEIYRMVKIDNISYPLGKGEDSRASLEKLSKERNDPMIKTIITILLNSKATGADAKFLLDLKAIVETIQLDAKARVSATTTAPTSTAPSSSASTKPSVMIPGMLFAQPSSPALSTNKPQYTAADLLVMMAIVNDDSWKGKYRGKTSFIKQNPPIIEELRAVVTHKTMTSPQKLTEINKIMQDGTKTNDSHNQHPDVQAFITAYKNFTLADFQKTMMPQSPKSGM